MTVMIAVYLIGGFILLVLGAEWLVRGAARIAALFNISPLVIGLTIVAFGTSAPELAVSTQSAWQGQGDIAIGNVVGSNIFNVLCVLGLTALIAPLIVSRQLVRFDVPLMILASFLAWGLAWDGHYSRFDGFILFACILLYTGYLIRKSLNATKAGQPIEPDDDSSQLINAGPTSPLINLGYLIAGLVLLVMGSRLLVSGAVDLATLLGLSELVIGLTVIAAGTSLPELATSAVAAWRGERDIAVGNIVGSNLFNLLAVLGVTALVSPQAVPVAAAALWFDFPVMLAVMIACLPIFYAGYRIGRWEGLMLFAYYLAYMSYLILNAQEHAFAAVLGHSLLVYVLPVTALLLVMTSARAWRQQRVQVNATE